MHLFIDKAPLLKALTHQQSLIERRSPVPLLTHVLLQARGQELVLTGTDLELRLVETLSAHVEQEGTLAVPAHIFYEIVRKVPEDIPICLREETQKTTQTGHLIMESGSIQFKLPIVLAKDFPVALTPDLPFSFQIPALQLKRLIDDTRFAMATEETRYMLNGIYFHFYGLQWRAVATDAQRLAVSWCPMAQETHLPPMIIGRKAIAQISQLLEQSPSKVLMAWSSQQVQLTFDRQIFSTRLVEGAFPEYAQAIPQDHPHRLVLDTKGLAQGITRVSMISTEKQRIVKLAFSAGRLTLSSHSLQYGSALETIEMAYEGPTLAMGFHFKSLLEICHHMKGSQMRIVFKDAVSPVLFEDLWDDHVFYIMMPVPTRW